VLAALLNDLASVPDPLIFVLDDYHAVDGADLRDGMVFLLDHLPPHVHLVISTRADPLLPLARIRARGELLEIRAADLRFTPDEAAAYLNDVEGLDLASTDIAALEGRTEGWIAALQLAALSMHGRADTGAFIASFAGDDRFIVDYLVEEVLQRQTDQVRTFLLRTCILDRLTGTLCDAVTELPGGKSTLEALDRANLFVVPLDDSRQWYRYHHLFADVLRAHLLEERPDDVPDLHRRASEWFDRNGEPALAVRHALAAGDTQRAADLVELAIPTLRRNRQEATIRGWLNDLPPEVIRARPVLAIGLAGGLMAIGEFEGVEELLHIAERLLETTGSVDVMPTADAIVADHAELARIPGAIEMYRAGLALLRGDADATLEHAQRAVDRAASGDVVVRASASALSGLARWGRGELDAAHQAYSVAVEGLLQAGHIADVLGCSITLADIRITQGRLGDALRTFERALELDARQPGPPLRGTADMHVGISQIACERNDLEAADRHLQRNHELGEHLGLPQNGYRSRVAMARLREAHGDLDGALSLLDDAQRRYAGDFSPNVRPVPAFRARVLAALGRVDEALQWARESGVAADADPSYVREFEHITLAKVLLAQHRTQRDGRSLQAAGRLLERLLAAAEAGGRTGSVLEILVLQAVVRQAAGDMPGALDPLARALALAEPQGYVRVFVGEGAQMADLLKAQSRRRTGGEYVGRLLRASVGRPSPNAPGSALTAGQSGSTAASTRTDARPHRLIDPLSERELDVLRLLASDLDGPEIARHLVVSLNTVRTHTKNIYAKLGVNSRRAAVRRAEELDLLSRRDDT
jgi:LuxR family transcriptional regulator, maltose regulon positive regulatory protein